VKIRQSEGVCCNMHFTNSNRHPNHAPSRRNVKIESMSVEEYRKNPKTVRLSNLQIIKLPPNMTQSSLLQYCLLLLQGHHKVTENKKSELMLMRCARAHSSSCSQVILAYVHPFCLTSLFCNRKSKKKFTRNPIFWG